MNASGNISTSVGAASDAIIEPVRQHVIAAINDRFRRSLIGGKVLISAGLADLGTNTIAKLLDAVRACEQFTADNDPYGEHDFGVVTVDGVTAFWKIDCYDQSMRWHEPDVTDLRGSPPLRDMHVKAGSLRASSASMKRPSEGEFKRCSLPPDLLLPAAVRVSAIASYRRFARIAKAASIHKKTRESRRKGNDMPQADIDMPEVPLQYVPSMETLAANEAEINRSLIDTLGKISQTTFDHSGHATRSVHAKSHGVLKGEMTVLEGLPSHLAQGLFAKPGRYPIAMRFSTLPGDILDDSVSTPRGLAVKVVGVDGPRLPGSEGDVTQDFVMVNGPAFSAPNAEKFLGVLKMLAATTDEAPGLKKVVSAIARGTESVIEAFGGKSATITTMGGQKETNILGETFYSQVPILYGDHIAKFSVAPLTDLKALTGAPIDTSNPNALRLAVSRYFADMGGEWEFRIQLCTDLEAMPIEDATVVWPEDRSPYLAVARLKVDPQPSWSPEKIAEIDEGLSFSPWHGLAAHRPLGSVMRARKSTYVSSAEFRSKHNGCPIHEPRRQ